MLEAKGRELEEVVAVKKKELEDAVKSKDKELADVIASHAKELEALKKAHADELAKERTASNETILGLQKEKSSFESYVTESCRQILGKRSCF